jgi:hypothetical protein
MIICAAKPALAYSLIDQLRRDYSVCITIIKHELARSKIKELVLVFFSSPVNFRNVANKTNPLRIDKKGFFWEKYTKIGIF